MLQSGLSIGIKENKMKFFRRRNKPKETIEVISITRYPEPDDKKIVAKAKESESVSDGIIKDGENIVLDLPLIHEIARNMLMPVYKMYYCNEQKAALEKVQAEMRGAGVNVVLECDDWFDGNGAHFEFSPEVSTDKIEIKSNKLCIDVIDLGNIRPTSTKARQEISFLVDRSEITIVDIPTGSDIRLNDPWVNMFHITARKGQNDNHINLAPV